MKIYEFPFISLQGKSTNLSEFEGKVILVVNTASKCGYTPQYIGLQELHAKYADKGLVILGFPCNQFGGQEPGDAKDISDVCLLNYGVEFLMSQKVEVNGENADPIFKYLQEALPGALGLKAIKWNFTKFLINKEGTPVNRFAPATEPKELEKYILELL
jgi:glutathione peroxidase